MVFVAQAVRQNPGETLPGGGGGEALDLVTAVKGALEAQGNRQPAGSRRGRKNNMRPSELAPIGQDKGLARCLRRTNAALQESPGNMR